MPQFCDVALAVPLDASFTYRIGENQSPVVGGRVIVPFREKKLSGIVVRLHDEEPKYKLKPIASVLDTEPVLDSQLLALGEWIASYYIAPLGEVYRTMLPLGAEFRQASGYRMTERGSEALYESATLGSSRRSKSDPDQQMAEYAVLDYLAEGELVREETIKSATGATRQILRNMVAKKWIAREDLSSVRDARRVVKFATLREVEGKLNANQQAIIDFLQSRSGRAAVDEISNLAVPKTTLHTLVKRGIIAIEEEAAELTHSGMQPRSTLGFIFTPAQQQALKRIQTSVAERQF